MSPRPPRLARRIRLSTLALGLSGPLLLATASPSAWAAAYDIPAGDLGAALSHFAAASGVTLSFATSETAGLQTPGLQGDYGLEDGFARLLHGSGLQVRQAGGNRYVLVKPAADQALEVGATTVGANALGATTEDSGSYTTGTMQTATRLPLSIRETPQAVTVITRQRMDDQAMTSINDVVKSTPGLFLSRADGPGRPSFHARGFAIDNVMYDGMPSSYQGWLVGVQPNLAMYDRVEVIRGATGLVTGSGNPAAAINLVHKRPTAAPSLSLTGAAGRWDDYRTEFDASTPLNDSGTLRGRVVGSYRDANGFRDHEEHDHGLLYAVGEADLGERTTVTLGYSHQEDQTNLFWGGLPLGADGHHLDLPRSSYPGSDWEDKHQVVDTLFAEVEHRFDNDWSLRMAGRSAWQDALFAGTYLQRNDDQVLRHSAYKGRYQEDQRAFDLYASGPLQAFGRTHELVAGVSRRDNDFSVRRYDGGGLIPLGAAKPTFTRAGKTREVTTQDGAYLTTRLSLADPLTLILGGRLDWYDYDNRTGDGDYKVTRNVTRYAGLVYDLDDHHSLYASYTDIFQPQTQKNTSGRLLTPISGKNYEVGIKGAYFDDALNASLALFQIDQKDRASLLRDQSGCPTYPGTSCYEAAGLVRSQGLDLELQGALTEQWQVGAGYTYTRARYVHDANAAQEGERFTTDQPEHLFKVSTVYRLQGPLENWRVGGSLYWQSRIYNDVTTAQGDYRVQQGSYAIADLLLGYQVNEHLDLQLNATNLLDRTYYSAIGADVHWGGYDTYGEPRNAMLTAKYTY
ncbi:TonB-dependent siderophore receptor [Pseudomonas mangiferae]|uniref:TonB-dependent siderophore receptor n=1 Tax=Pseudomonas mangiferae TaxID=2593654 RepID=A0A553GWG9_9PSED|nr:TonB-dependent receptor [Pseudomonas mangiferae]TRX73839.1 TonB-dependent siderophore receptor [Pseudomonas mangiferae]